VNSRTNPLLVTTVAGQHHSISLPLSFEASNLNPTDLVLGLDWAAYLRDSLLGLGYRVDASFGMVICLASHTSYFKWCI
jgi:hypothetical protein